MKIAIYGRIFSAEFRKYSVEFFGNLKEKGIDITIYQPFLEFLESEMHCNLKYSRTFSDPGDAPADVDFLISIGGDGTFLRNFDIPVIGLNSGRLGFMANISKEEISESIDSIIRGDYEVEQRSMINIDLKSGGFGKFNYALNEVTVQKNDSAMINIDAYLDNEFLNSYWTDGLIVSTPTGSTAYNLSVGGPIVLPGSNNFIIVPIASHNLTVRPLVIPDNKEIRLEVKSRSGVYLLTADNRKTLMDEMAITIVLKRASFNLKMVNLPFNNYYSTLRNKLMWGADKRN